MDDVKKTWSFIKMTHPDWKHIPVAQQHCLCTTGITGVVLWGVVLAVWFAVQEFR